MSKKLNICFLGDKQVGKSSTINTMVNSYFDRDEKYIPTIESKLNKLYTHNKILYNLNIHDTAGSIEMQSLLNDTIKQCNAFVIMYSLTDRSTYDSIYMYKELIKETFCVNKNKNLKFENIPIILVANKKDCTNDIKFSYTEITDISKSFNFSIHTISSSACLNSVQTIFNKLIDQYEQIEKKQLKEIKKNEKEKEKQKIFSSKKKSIIKNNNNKITSSSISNNNNNITINTNDSEDTIILKNKKNFFKKVLINLKFHKLIINKINDF